MTKQNSATDQTPTNNEETPVADNIPRVDFTSVEKVPLKVSDDRALIMDPRQLVMACDPGHPLYQGLGPDHESYKPSADAQPTLAMAEGMARFGWEGGAIEARKLGGQAVIEDGRQRAVAATIATMLRAEDRDAHTIATMWHFPLDEVQALLKGKNAIPVAGPVNVRVFLNQDDAASAMVKSIMLNRHRRQMNVYEEAMEIKQAKRLGVKDAELKVAYGWESTDTVKNRLKLLEAAPEVIDELKAGRITASDALRMVHLPQDKQVKALTNIPKKDPSQPKKRRTGDAAKAAKGAAKKNTANTGARKPTHHALTQILDEIEDKSPAHYTLRYAMGLVSIATAAPHMGLSKESPVYRHLKDRENEQKAGE